MATNEIHGILYDDARKLLGEDELYCVFKNLTFGFFALHNKVEFGCFSCDSKENEILFHKLNDELKKRESLPDFTHVTAGKDVFHFCNWLELLMEQSETSPVLDPNQNPINSFAAWIILLCMSFSIIIILALWVWKRNCVQEKSSFNGKQMDENLEMLNITNPTGPTFEESEIGNGAHGRVVVLKGYPEPAVKKILTSKDPQYLDRFKQEFEFLKALKHPHVVKLLWNIVNVEIYLVVSDLKKENKFPVLLDPTIVYSMKMVITWGEQLFDAVHYMYREKSVVHRDIKPDNIFVTMSFDLKIGDFGLAKHIEKTCVGSCVGTHRYMSPSQDSNESQGRLLGIWLKGNVQYKQLQAIIERCANFDREARPKASEILHQILFIKKEDVFIKALKFLIDQTEQTTIFRPIGFDRTEERVPIDGMTSSYHDLLPHHA
ncbi:unnamed protein product, partial [Mesorhabditis belari]|uniref:non-specific serine/threonine protein kinase n=1 Tax=Mesorhabditis belari TaxID=2138241 RepID=A0AAF3FL69_9BILA